MSGMTELAGICWAYKCILTTFKLALVGYKPHPTKAKYIMRLKFFLFLIGFMAASSAQAQCVAPGPAGQWKPMNRDFKTIVRLEIIHRCSSKTGSAAPLPGAKWTVRAWSWCRPRNCRWGRVVAQETENGLLRAIFPLFSSERHLEIIPDGSRIEVHYNFDYRHVGKKDVRGKIPMIRAD